MKIETIKKESNSLGLHVAILVKRLKECETLTIFETNFKQELEGIKTGTGLKLKISLR